MKGESGPKIWSKDVVDGKQVNIPVLIFIEYRRTKKAIPAGKWISVQLYEKKYRRKTILYFELGYDKYFYFRDVYLDDVKLPRKVRNI